MKKPKGWEYQFFQIMKCPKCGREKKIVKDTENELLCYDCNMRLEEFIEDGKSWYDNWGPMPVEKKLIEINPF